MKKTLLLSAWGLPFLTLLWVTPVIIPWLSTTTQITCGTGPALFDPLDPYWTKGTTVTVKFKQGDFTPTQRGTMGEAFEAWESRRFNNCSEVTFVGYQEFAATPRSGRGRVISCG